MELSITHSFFELKTPDFAWNFLRALYKEIKNVLHNYKKYNFYIFIFFVIFTFLGKFIK